MLWNSQWQSAQLRALFTQKTKVTEELTFLYVLMCYIIISFVTCALYFLLSLLEFLTRWLSDLLCLA